MKILILLVIIQFFIITAGANIINKDEYVLEISMINTPVTIDGILNESVWDTAGSDTNFWLHYPVDTGRAYAKTEVKMMYDNENLYIGFICYENMGKPVIQSLKRDDGRTFRFGDGITVIMDPANMDKNGYFFSANAAGAEQDGIVSQNGMNPVSNGNWNNKWHIDVSQKDDIIYYEMALPFSAIKYSESNNRWGINFVRNDTKRNAYYLWTPFAANIDGFDFGHNGSVVFKDGLPMGRSDKLILMPSFTSGVYYDRENNDKVHYEISGGLDAKYSISPSLNLDASIYPDFSNVAVDRQFIDFYRFEYYMHEQRGLFLENNDLFTNFGSYDDPLAPATENKIKPLYTRRIGITDGENVPIIYGTRLSGNLTNDLRIGLLNLQTEEYEEQKAQNYMIAVFQQNVFKRSSVKGLFTNRNANKGVEFQKDDFNRTGGIEFNYASKNNKWTGNMKFHNSFNPEHFSDNKFYGGGFTFSSKYFKMQNWVHHVEENYIADLGFIPRLYHEDPVTDTTYRRGFTHILNKYELIHYPYNNIVSIYGNFFNLNTFLNDKGEIEEYHVALGLWSSLANSSDLMIIGSYNEFDLVVPYDLFDNDNPIPTGIYKNTAASIIYRSNQSNALKYNASVHYGGFYNGTRLSFSGRPGYTIRPYGTISLVYTYADIQLAEESGHETYHLIGSNTEIGFTTRLLWTSLFQYNTQQDNINFNSIFQWRFAPMSDFYIVLKDDFSESATNKKFELSFKITYWISI